MKLKELFFCSALLVFFVFSIAAVSATRYIKYDVKDGVLFYGGYAPGTTPLANVNVIGYVCSNSDCSSASATLWNGQIKNSDGNSYLVVDFPTTLQNANGYGLFFYKPGYVTWEQAHITYAGTKPGESYTTPTFSTTAYLTKANICRAQIDTFSVTNNAKPNMPIAINVTASLDATTYSALNHAGPINFVPPSLKDDYYSVRTTVYMEIYNSSWDIVASDSAEILIPFSEQKRLYFTWTPSLSGDYVAAVYTYVNDNKCMDSEYMEADKYFFVLQEEPNQMCYTLLNNLSASPLFAEQGDTITISARKISNSALNDVLTPLPTTVTLYIETNNSLVYTETKHISANSNNHDFKDIVFTWTAASTAMHSIVMSAIAENCPYSNNTQETETINYYIYKQPECDTNSDCGTDGYIGAAFCSTDDLYRDYREWTCNNPSQENAYCTSNVYSVKLQDCVYGCQNGACINVSQITCFNDSGCGQAHFLNNPFCKNNDLYDYYLTYTCHNSGTINSYCTNSTSEQLKQDCSYSCLANSCFIPVCFNNSQCDDGNSHTEDICLNPGTVNATCIHNTIRCFTGVECGGAYFLNTPFCSGSNLYDYFIGFTCNNPGTSASYCSNSTSPVQIQSCVYGCYNNACINPSQIRCFNNSDCNDYNLYTQDICLYPGTINSTCIYNNIACLSNADCNDNNAYTQDICNAPGLPGSFCSYNNIACLSDADCSGRNYFFDGTFCQSNSVYRKYAIFSCQDPGSVNSCCVSTINITRIFEACPYGCENGVCIERRKLPSPEDLYVTDIIFGISDRFFIHDKLYFSVSLKNEAELPLEDLHISVVIYDLGVKYAFGDFDLKKGQRATKSKIFDLQDVDGVKPGRYDARVTISNDNIKRIIHREVVII